MTVARLELNVAARPFVNERPLVVATAVLVVVLAAASFTNIFTLLGALREGRERSARVIAAVSEAAEARAEAKRLGATLTDRERRRLRAVAASTTAIIDKRRLSWTRLFEQLELVLPRDVRILSVQPNPEGRHMTLLMECIARSDEALHKFFRKLDEPPFREAYILAQSLEEGKVRFSVRCRYETAGAAAVAIYEPMSWQLATPTPTPTLTPTPTPTPTTAEASGGLGASLAGPTPSPAFTFGAEPAMPTRSPDPAAAAERGGFQ